jgi:adenylylsulfate kinase
MEKTGAVIWFTGLAGSGKSTVASVVEAMLRERDLPVENLDADEVRQNLSPNLGFSLEARDENTKRLAWMGKVLSRHGVNVVIAAVATLRRFRDRAREMCPHFVEVYVKCPLEICQERDPKGLYSRRARGEINDVDGIDIPYEEPAKAEVVFDTSTTDVETCAKMVVAKLEELGYL